MFAGRSFLNGPGINKGFPPGRGKGEQGGVFLNNRRLSLTVFVTFLLAVLTIGYIGNALETKKNEPELQPFPHVDTSISTREEQAAETNVTPLKNATRKPKIWYSHQVVVLMYHHVSEKSKQPYAITPELFARHMSFLHENGFNPITLDEFTGFLQTGDLSTANAVFITFDDGYESYYTDAFPILRRYGYPSVNFIIADRLRDGMDRKPENMTTPLTRQEVAEMAGTGLAAFGSHTYSLHDAEERNEWGELGPETAPVFREDLQRLEVEQEYRDRLYVDFNMSRVGLGEWTGHQVDAISLPFGYTNTIVRETARQAGYRFVFTSTPGVVKRGTDPFTIPRYDVGLPSVDETSLHQLFTKAKNEFEGEQS